LFQTWHSRFAHGVDAARDWLRTRKIVSGKIVWKEDVHFWHPGQKWIWEPGGFGVFDPGINAFSIATKIFPGGLFVDSAELSFPANAQTPIAADVVFRIPQADGPLGASLDWRRTEGEEWTITIKTSDGVSVRLEDGGSKLLLDGKLHEDVGIGEYPDIYRTFVDLIDERRSLVDVAPLRLVADCLLTGARKSIDTVMM
jgi:predicted dehydrogenase